MFPDNLSNQNRELSPAIKILIFVLALAFTTTSISLSVVMAWQHSQVFGEQVLWALLLATPVLAVHFIPALHTASSHLPRLVVGLLWVFSLILVQYNHASFFLHGQRQMGDLRAEAITPVQEVTSAPFTPKRSLTDVAGEIATVNAELSKVAPRPCMTNCTWLKQRRDVLMARLVALQVETDEVKRWQIEHDRQAVLAERDRDRRDEAHDDPVMARVSGLLGMTLVQLDLFVALAFSIVLDGVGCLCWWLAFHQPKVMPSVTLQATERVPIVTEPVMAIKTMRAEAITSCNTFDSLDSDVRRVRTAIEAGDAKMTVSSIRRYLGCAQEKARRIRAQLAISSDQVTT